MKYLDIKSLDKYIEGSERYRRFLAEARSDADRYFSSFDDSTSRISRWAHHYFCKKEGGRLIYNPESPESHVCSICGTEYSSDLLNGVWYTIYRNEGAVNAWKSALIYRTSGEKKYLDYLISYVSWYDKHYLDFRLHKKEGEEFDTLEEAGWGCSRIMPQSLNESIFIIRIINALEMVREDLPEGFIEGLEKGLFAHVFELFRPQVNEIHNIPTWLNSGIAVMGLFTGNKEMIDFAFNGKLGLKAQLEKGVTADGFWYEGSIHYNFFLLEGVVNALLFAELKGYSFPEGKEILAKMLESAYGYAFDNHQFPNPNDGWPDLNLKTYSYVYSASVKVLGEDSQAAKLLGAILNQKVERGTVPLSKPIYFDNDVSMEEILFARDVRDRYREIPRTGSRNFPSSNCSTIKGNGLNIFVKYGHNGPSHAHPDKMEIEVLYKDVCLSRDLSNSGYGNPFCNEWHRVSASHNTVVIGGENHTGLGMGEILAAEDDYIKVSASEVYEGTAFTREIRILDQGFSDVFEIEQTDVKDCDYFFHVEGVLESDLVTEPARTGYTNNGYQHLKDVRKVCCRTDNLELRWDVKGVPFSSVIDMRNKEIFIMQSPDNPVVNYRTTMMIRETGRSVKYKLNWTVNL
ncbi:MAG: heparinase II/III family protein [Spirochaetales bacterium]|nr:heparinase II/III family protein [Spirochaetales bacterium]